MPWSTGRIEKNPVPASLPVPKSVSMERSTGIRRSVPTITRST
jgi:hypothetical protein